MKTLTQDTITYLKNGDLLFKGDITGSYDYFIGNGGKRFQYFGLNEEGNLGVADYPCDIIPEGFNDPGVNITWKSKFEMFQDGDWHFIHRIRFN